jgi:hypothetical protein
VAKCFDCELNMSDDTTNTCTYNELYMDGKWYKRNSTYFDVNERCHDCNILNQQGNYHHSGCDMERCPKCGGQLIGCGCNPTGARKNTFVI